MTLLQRAIVTLEPRFTARVLRTLTHQRKRLDRESLTDVISQAYRENDASVKDIRAKLLELVKLLPSKKKEDESSMEVDDGAVAAVEKKDESAVPPAATPTTATKEKEKDVQVGESLPEGDVYLRLLVILGLIDAKALEQASSLAQETVKHIHTLNRRSMDHLAAKIYFYLARVHELLGRQEEIRPMLLAAQSTASLRHDEDLQGTLINLLLRNYFAFNLYDQADKLLSKTTFPESSSNTQLARYLFYLGRIRAVQLNYSESRTHLQHAIRRSPSPNTAPGFVQTVHKFFVVVELLMGDIPDRSIFRQPVLKKALVPYFQIVQAVRVGDLEAFQTALTTHSSRFVADGTHTLILRLRHNVIKTALRMISLAYSRISLKDICLKLHLDSEEDTEYIVAKAIRDGVIDAELDHAKGLMKSKESGNVYETDEPQKAFQQRIQFCMTLHNDSVKAMRYPLNANKTSELTNDFLVCRKEANPLTSALLQGSRIQN